MNICPKCGVKDTGGYCPECGTKMVAIEENQVVDSEVIPKLKTCPNCGSTGDYLFCPNCGTKMEERQVERKPEEEKPVAEEPFKSDDAIERPLEEAEKESEVIDPKSLGQSIAPDKMEPDKAMTGVLAAEVIGSADGETRTNESEESIGRKSEPVSSEISKNRLAETEQELKEKTEKKAQRKRRRRRILKIAGIIIGIIVLAFIALIIIGTALQDDFDHDMDSPKDASINSLNYQYPGNWEETEDESEVDVDENEHVKYVRYNTDDGSFMGRMFVYYLGDDVIIEDPSEYFGYFEDETQSRTLTVGDTEVAVKEYSTSMESGEGDDTVVSPSTSYAATFEKDYSSFLVVIEALNDYYDADFCDAIIQKIDLNGYKNPRTAEELTAKYTGESTPGTEITEGDTNVKVTVKYTNGDKDRAQKWTLDKSITIEEGKTNEATVSCHGLTCTLEATGRKPVELDAEYGGSTKAGTKITKDDITVTVKYDNGDKEEVTDFKIGKSVKLKAGETSTIKVTYGDLTDELKVECTTLSKEQYKAKCVNRNYKNQLRKESKGQYIKIYGQVLQDCGYGFYRISSSGGYDDVYMVYAPDSDIVEDDWCTVYGKTAGIYEYETVMGANQKVPEIEAKYVER